MPRPYLRVSGLRMCLFVNLIICGVYALDNWVKLLYPIELKTLDYRFKVRGKK